MWRYGLHPPHLINVATLPCESRNSENVILQWDITKENCINVSYMLHQNGHVDCKIWGLMQQCMYGTKICDIYDLQKCLMQTWVDSEQNVIEAAIDQWRDCLRSLYACLWRTLWTHAAKLLFICTIRLIRTFYETVNVIWCIWQLFCS